MIDTFVTDAFRQWLEGECPPARVRELENGQGLDAAWRSLQDSGFCDALTSEAHGGAGASLETVAQMLFDAGRHALPLPFGATLWARAALAERELSVPSGPITLARGRMEGDTLYCANVDLGRLADHVMVVLEDRTLLVPTASAECRDDGIHASLNAILVWQALPEDTVTVDTNQDWSLVGAALFAAQIAGAAERTLNLALAYAGERKQFGKPIGKFQALQQRLSVCAEEVFATRMAMQLALRGRGPAPEGQVAMVAKARCSAAVPEITAVAHLVHGAIGITEEYDLQLFSRRLHDWRLQFGSERFWHRRLGADVLNHDESALAVIRRWSQAG